MTKLCNSCEYLKFCARSGIEDIGCDRYKRDATTNEEWFCSLSTEEKAKVLVFINNGGDINDIDLDHCSQKDVQKMTEWLKEIHE